MTTTNNHGGRRQGSGRRSMIDPARVIALRRDPERYTWKQIAEMLEVSEDTAMRAFKRGKPRVPKLGFP